MQEQVSQFQTIVTALFTDVLQQLIVAILLIIAIIALGKFLKKSNIKNAKILYTLGFAYLGKELIVTLSSLIKSIFITIVQGTISSTSSAAESPMVKVYQSLNTWNIWFITSIVIVVALYFILKPNFTQVSKNEEELTLDEEELIEVQNDELEN